LRWYRDQDGYWRKYNKKQQSHRLQVLFEEIKFELIKLAQLCNLLKLHVNMPIKQKTVKYLLKNQHVG